MVLGRQNVLSGNGSAHLVHLNRHQLAANGAATPVRQVSTNGAVRQFPSGLINTNVLANNGANFGHTNLTNLTQMRPSINRINMMNGSMLGLANGTNVYDMLQSPRQNNVNPASVSTSNGGNNSVGTPSPQPQAEQRTVR
jgi:hypothetical protein